MKAIKSIIALALMAATSAPALAESVDVKVIGTIAPVACTPTLSGGGVIDYGNIPANSLSQTDYTLLAEKQLDLAITCEAPAKVAVAATNGRPGTLAGGTEGASGFGNTSVKGIFGSDTGGFGAAGLGMAGEAKIGGYALRFVSGSVTLDDKSAISLTRANGGDEWKALPSTSTGSLLATTPRQITWAEPGTIAPLAFTTMAGKIGVQAYINKASELDLTQPITLDGLTTLELVYL